MQLSGIVRFLATAIMLSGSIIACVEPYDLDYDQTKRILIVDGVLSDNPNSPQTISIRESIPNGSRNFYLPISGATVEVIVDNSERFRFKDIEKGNYLKPFDLIIEEKRQYRLEFKLADGRSYVSENESFTATSLIDRIYTQLELEGIPKASGYSPAHYVYLDTQDKPGKGNNYVWSWKLFEKQNICQSCINGRFFVDRRTGVGACRDESAAIQINDFFYDYQCEGDCWQLFYNERINAMSDTYVDGNPILGRLIAKIPVYQYNGALLEVKQQSVSPSAFRYLKLLTEQSQNNGGLADTPPAALIGNVRDVNNPTEAVGGYFMVASERTTMLWIDRRDAVNQNLPTIGFLGRPISLEVTNDPSRPPLAPCTDGRFRTPNKPNGWIN
ncbi:MAG: hypothetical protein ACI9V1_003134 [Spirosomataceae bacterium]|jgi:hypothetical protein